MRERLVPMLALAAFLACVPPALLHFLGRESVHFSSGLHFGLVALGATAATGAALALTVVGARRRDGRAVLVGERSP